MKAFRQAPQASFGGRPERSWINLEPRAPPDLAPVVAQNVLRARPLYGRETQLRSWRVPAHKEEEISVGPVLARGS